MLLPTQCRGVGFLQAQLDVINAASKNGEAANKMQKIDGSNSGRQAWFSGFQAFLHLQFFTKSKHMLWGVRCKQDPICPSDFVLPVMAGE
jgi:hypothetical protein